MAIELTPASHSPTELVVKSASPTVFGQSEYITVITSDAPDYEGSYVVTPKAHSETVLPTNNRVMRDDVTVLRVPYYETSNPSGGYTAYIAEEA